LPNYGRLISRILSGSADRNIRFADVRRLLVAFGFQERISGDHHIYSRAGIIEIINLQPGQNGLAKPYQIRQVRGLIVKYGLEMEDEQ
jgi:hypothetical protein